MDNKPLARHESLQPLSRHHHHALVLAQRLMKSNDETPHDELDDTQAQVSNFWSNGGREHFREEEEYLLPEYAKYQSLNHPEIRQLLLEHVKIRSLVSEVCAEGHTGKMAELGVLLRDHVRREERVVFPLIEQALPPEALEKLAPFFSEHLASSVYYDQLRHRE